MRKANPFYGWMIVLGTVVFLVLSALISLFIYLRVPEDGQKLFTRRLFYTSGCQP